MTRAKLIESHDDYLEHKGKLEELQLLIQSMDRDGAFSQVILPDDVTQTREELELMAEHLKWKLALYEESAGITAA